MICRVGKRSVSHRLANPLRCSILQRFVNHVRKLFDVKLRYVAVRTYFAHVIFVSAALQRRVNDHRNLL